MAFNLELFNIIGETCIHDKKVAMMAWKKPPKLWTKINTDCSAIKNLGMIGASGIIRDKNGKMVLDFVVPISVGIMSHPNPR